MNNLQNWFATEGVLLILSTTIIKASPLHGEGIDAFSNFNSHSLPADERQKEEPYTLQRRNDFFLKVAGKSGKSVPRIGRRNIIYPDKRENIESPFKVHRRNDFFLKAHKSIPRIGRRNSEEPQAVSAIDDHQARYSQLITKKFDSEGMEKAEASAWPWFRTPGLYHPQKKAVYFTEDPAYFGPGVILWDRDEHPALLLEDSETNFTNHE